MNIVTGTVAGAILLVSGLSAQEAIPGNDQSTLEIPFEWGLTSSWDRHYVLEGRDTLDGESLWSYTLGAGYGPWLLEFWHAEGASSGYTELNLLLQYNFKLGGLSGYASYMHLWFVTDDAADNEMAFGFFYEDLPWGLIPSVGSYYSWAAHGWFTETSLSREFALSRLLTLRATAHLGINHGYLPEGHRGADHCGLRLEAAFQIRENIELTSHLTQSWALGARPDRFAQDELLGDLFFGALPFRFDFKLANPARFLPKPRASF